MAPSHRPVVRSRPARAVRRHGFLRLLAAGMICGFGYLGFTTGAFGPAEGLAETLAAEPSPTIALASISFSGDAPVITGSVGHLFQGASFTGPNRAEKTDRKRPAVDALRFSSGFAEIRQHIASLRGETIDPALPGQSLFAANDAGPEGPRMSMAAINPATAAALDAIAGIAPPLQMPLPMPALASEQLAYARANTPATGGFASGESRKVSDKDMWCLATAIYFEARGESYRGQVAVAQVVLNRVNDHRYPETICGVVYQNQNRRNACQFSFACDGIPEVINDQESWAQAQDIAQRYMAGSLYLTEVGDATHYHATYVSPAWAPRMTRVTQIGLHVFYKFKRGWLFG